MPTRAPCARPGQRKICRNRGLADAALTGGHGHDILESLRSGDSCRCTACAVISCVELDIDVGRADHRRMMGLQAASELLLDSRRSGSPEPTRT